MTFQTVEQLQATVAEQAQEIKRLTNENWRLQAGEAVMLKPHLGLISRLTGENERLRGALKAIADDCEADYPPSHGAIKYAARAALQPKEGE